MADLANRKSYTSDFSGLTTNAYILAAAALVFVGWYEASRHLKRLPHWRLASEPATRPDNPERWELAHLYTPREYHAVAPTAPLPRWPLLWIWPSIMRSDWWYATHPGIDALMYVRFLRAATWWMFIQSLTTLPILLAVHLEFSNCDSRKNMACASLAYLVTTPLDPQKCSSLAASDCTRTTNHKGRRWLWIHLLIMYWLTLSWVLALFWAARGVVQTRRLLILRLRHRTLQGPHAVRKPSDSNLEPLSPTIEHAILDELARQAKRADDGAHPFYSASVAQRDPNFAGWRQRTLMCANLPRAMRNEQTITAFIEEHLGVRGGPTGWSMAKGSDDEEFLPSPVQSIVFVRKMAELDGLVSRRDGTLAKLELAHMELAQNVLRQVRAIMHSNVPPEKNTSPDMVLAQRLGRFVRSDSQVLPDATSSFWHELLALPRALLDRHQPITEVTSGTYKGDVVPTIDLLVTKLRLLTALVDAARALPESKWDSTAVAFITLRDPRQARMIWRELGDQVSPHIQLAPERRDIMWDRMMHSTAAARVVRGLGVSAFFWLFTVFWMIPTQGAASVLNNISGITRASQKDNSAFTNHSQWMLFVSGTLPTLLVSGIMLLVPEFIFQVHLRAHRFLTRTELYDQCLCKYWKFVVCNTVILFSVGSTTLQTILLQKDSSHQGSVLTSIAFAFPTAAPFFCAYLMLNIATQTGAELIQAVIGLIQAVQAVGAKSPRDRTEKVLPRKFGHAIWLPLHLTVMTIVFIFAIFNPLVIPFAMAYLWCALIVFKKDLAYVYLRRFHENQGHIYMKRILRFSLDGLVVAQVVLAIFFAVTKEKAVYLCMTILLMPITLAAKLLGTRLWNSQCRSLDDDESNAICGIDTLPSWILLREAYQPTTLDPDTEEALRMEQDEEVHDARSAGRYPRRIPVVPNETRWWRWFHHWLDLFCANGTDSPGWVSLLYSTPRRDLLEQHQIQLDTKAPAVIRSFVAMWAARGHLLNFKGGRNSANNAQSEMSTYSTDDPQHNHAGYAEVGDRPSSATSQKELVHRPSGARVERYSDVCDDEVGYAPSTKYEVRLGVRGRWARDQTQIVANRSPNTLRPTSTYDDVKYGDRKMGLYSDDDLEYMPEVTQNAPWDSDLDSLLHDTPPLSSPMKHLGAPRVCGPKHLSDSTLVTVENSPLGQWSKGAAPRPLHDEKRRSMGPGLSPPPRPNPTRHESDATLVPPSRDERGRSRSSVARRTSLPPIAIPKPGSPSSSADGSKPSSLRSMAKLHPPILWDDRPDDLARYTTPAYSSDLDRSLWLPINPATRLDLAQTIDWTGPAFVSSWYGSSGSPNQAWDGPVPKALTSSEIDPLGTLSIAGSSTSMLPWSESPSASTRNLAPGHGGAPRARGVALPTLLRRVVVEEETRARRAFRVAEAAQSVVSQKKRKQRKLDRHRARIEDGYHHMISRS